MSWEIKVAAHCILRSRVRTHPPVPPKRLITYALYLLSKIFSFPSFVCFPNPFSLWHSLQPEPRQREKHPLLPLTAAGWGGGKWVSILLPCLRDLQLLGVGCEGGSAVPLNLSPPPPSTAERRWGVAASSHGNEETLFLSPHSPGRRFPVPAFGKSWDPWRCTRDWMQCNRSSIEVATSTNAESLFGTSEVSKVECMQKKTPGGYRKKIFALLISKIILISSLYHPSFKL